MHNHAVDRALHTNGDLDDGASWDALIWFTPTLSIGRPDNHLCGAGTETPITIPVNELVTGNAVFGAPDCSDCRRRGKRLEPWTRLWTAVALHAARRDDQANSAVTAAVTAGLLERCDTTLFTDVEQRLVERLNQHVTATGGVDVDPRVGWVLSVRRQLADTDTPPVPAGFASLWDTFEALDAVGDGREPVDARCGALLPDNTDRVRVTGTVYYSNGIETAVELTWITKWGGQLVVDPVDGRGDVTGPAWIVNVLRRWILSPRNTFRVAVDNGGSWDDDLGQLAVNLWRDGDTFDGALRVARRHLAASRRLAQPWSTP